MPCLGVTGATGYIGGALVPSLSALGYDLRMVDDRSGPIRVEYPNRPALSLDFASNEALKALSDCDVILHLAAASGVMACARDPVGTARVNVEGTRRLYEMCRQRRIPVAFASSFAVVGAPERLPVTEQTPARPTHEYARQKAAGEVLTAELARMGEAGTATLRQSNVYGGYVGAGRLVTKGNVLEQFARQAWEGRLLVNSPGTQRRDFIHIDDVVQHWQAAAKFLLRARSPSVAPTFNVASGEAFSVLELAARVVRIFAGLHPDLPAVRVEVVANPREGIELVEPAFSVDRSATERALDLRCRHRLEDELPKVLQGADTPRRLP